MFNGKIHYFDWAIFNSYVKLPEGKACKKSHLFHVTVSTTSTSRCTPRRLTLGICWNQSNNSWWRTARNRTQYWEVRHIWETYIYDIWEDVALWDTISMVSDSKNIQKPWYKMRSTYRPAGWQVKPAIDDGSGPPSNTHPVHINIVHGQLHGRHPGTWQRPNLDCRYFMIHHRNSLDTSDKPYNAWTLCLYDMNRIVMRRFGTDPKTNLQNYCEPRVGPTSITSPCFLSMNCARAKTLINDNHRIVFPERPGKSNYSRVSKASITTCSENTIAKTWGHNDELPERPSKLWFKF